MSVYASYTQSFKNALKKNDQTFLCYKSQTILSFLFFLQRNSLIRRISYAENNLISVELRLSKMNIPLIRDIHLCSKRERKFISVETLRHLCTTKLNQITVVSTSVGFLTGSQAIQKNVGGVLVASIEI